MCIMQCTFPNWHKEKRGRRSYSSDNLEERGRSKHLYQAVIRYTATGGLGSAFRAIEIGVQYRVHTVHMKYFIGGDCSGQPYVSARAKNPGEGGAPTHSPSSFAVL